MAKLPKKRNKVREDYGLWKVELILVAIVVVVLRE